MTTDNTNTDQAPEQIDPVADAAEQLLYGDPATAGESLRQAIHHEAARLNQHQANQGRFHAELNRRHGYLKRFKEENPEFMDNVAAVAAGEMFCYHEQMDDLQKAGVFDREKFRKENGRDPSPKEISNLHLEAAAYGLPGIRPVEDWFDRAAERAEEQVPAARRRIRDQEHNRKRAIQGRLKVSANSHGVDLDKYATDYAPTSRQPNIDAGEQVSVETIQAADRRSAGEGGEDLTAKRSAAFNKFFANRGGGTDRRPGAGNVRVTRTPDDNRYADRRGAE